MSEVWVVTTGCYSDMDIVGVFSSKEKADAFLEFYKDDGCSCADVFVIDAMDGVFPKGKQLYWVQMDRNGDNTLVRVAPPINGGLYSDFRSENRRDGKRQTRCWARDVHHALKIANERRVQAIVSGEWSE